MAQIPNSGFEDWTNAGGYWSPYGWWSTNDSAGGTYYAITSSTDHYPLSVGEYSLRLENNVSILPDWGAVGLVWTGGWNGNNYPAFPITGHPVSLCGYYKFFPQNNDTMEIHIRLYKNGTDIGGGQFKSAATAAVWTGFVMPFSSYTEADSARIMISSCYDNDAPIPHGNSVLYIDNLNFDNLISDGIAEAGSGNLVSVYPNPASRTLTITFKSGGLTEAAIEIYDVTGRSVLSQNSAGKEPAVILDVSNFGDGIYFIRISSGTREIYSRKIVIAK